MKSKKKVISIILSLLIVLSIVSTNMIFVFAGTVKESEANNTADNANAVSLGSSIIGSVSSSSDVDYYEFTVSKNGYIEIEFSNPVLTNGKAKWAIVVYKFAESLHEIHYHSISATKAKTELPKIGVTPGTYYIKVQGGGDRESYIALVNNVEYSIKTDFTATEYWESEINGDFSTADKINFGNTYGGYLKNSSDADYYEFTVTSNGYVEIAFANPVLTNDIAKWAIAVYKYSDSYEEIHYHSISATKAKTELPKIGVTPGTYYIKVQGGGDRESYIALVNNVEYSIKTDFTATDYWESEINGDFLTADAIYGDIPYSGYIRNTGDVDCYKFTVTKNGYVEIAFVNPVLTNDIAKWAITVYKYSDSYEEIHYHSVSATKAKTELPKIGVTPGTYYIKVQGGGDRESYKALVNNVEYSLKVVGDCVEITPDNQVDLENKPNVSEVALGDVNNDGFVDAGDAVLISRYDAGFITLSDEQLEAGDVNDDGTVDAGDAVVISRFDAGFISSIR